MRSVFRSSKFGTVAGCMVIDGYVRRNFPIRVLRNNVVIFEGALESLKRFKDDVNEVRAGTECGIGVKNYNDVQRRRPDRVLFAGRSGAHAVGRRAPSVRRMAKDNPRARRLGEQIQRELTELLRRDVKDERIGNVTITAVTVTRRSAHGQGVLPGLRPGGRGPEGAARPGERRRVPAQCAVEVADDPLHADAELRARYLDRARRAPDAVDRFGQQAEAEAVGEPMLADVHGILLLDKPLGLSSAGAVARVKRLFGARKAGHTGSLDPLASGMLPICFGEATKFGAQLLDADKTYRVTRAARRAHAERRPGIRGDRAARAAALFAARRCSGAATTFRASTPQMPPMHSAHQAGRQAAVRVCARRQSRASARRAPS